MPDPVSENIAQNIRRLRDERGISQQQAANLAEVPRPTWANLESGQANPTILVLTKVARALNVRIEELLAPPHPSVRCYPAESLPRRRRGKVTVRSLLAEPVPGLELERIVLPPLSQLASTPHAPSTLEHLTCEIGELDLEAGGQQHRLRAGDVAIFRGDQAHAYRNPGGLRCVAYCIVTLSSGR